MIAQDSLIPFPLAFFIALAFGIAVSRLLPAHMPRGIYFLTGVLLSYGVLASIEVINRRFRRERKR